MYVLLAVLVPDIQLPDVVAVEGCRGESVGRCVRVCFRLVGGREICYTLRPEKEDSVILVYPGFEEGECLGGG